MNEIDVHHSTDTRMGPLDRSDSLIMQCGINFEY